MHLPVGYASRLRPDEQHVVDAFTEGRSITYGFAVGDARATEADALFQEAVAQWMGNAFDDAQGAGRGQAVLQLLVDGSPGKYANLLRDLTVDNGGPLPASDLVDNLYSRPASEHRQLLNKSLEDLIDRALSSAADELPDEIFDDMYGQVAGYRKRLGL